MDLFLTSLYLHQLPQLQINKQFQAAIKIIILKQFHLISAHQTKIVKALPQLNSISTHLIFS